MGIKYNSITGKLFHTVNEKLVDACPDACLCCDSAAGDKAYVKMSGWPAGNCCDEFNGCFELDKIADCEWEKTFAGFECCGAIEGALQPGAMIVPGLRGVAGNVREMFTFGLGFADNAAPGDFTINLKITCVADPPSTTITLTITCGEHEILITRTVGTATIDCDLPLMEGVAPTAGEIADFALCDASGVLADASLMPLDGCECTCCADAVPTVIHAYLFATVGLGDGCNDACEALNGALVVLTRLGEECTWRGTGPLHPCYPMSTFELTMVCDADDTTITLVWQLDVGETVVYRLVVPTPNIDCTLCQPPISLSYVVGGTTCGFGASFVNLYPVAHQLVFDVSGVGLDNFNCPGNECDDLNAAFVLSPGPTNVVPACALPWDPNDADYLCEYTVDFPFCAGSPAGGDGQRSFQIAIYGFLGVGWKVVAGYKSPGTYNFGNLATQSDICIVWLQETAGTGVLEDYSDTLTFADECGACAVDCDWPFAAPPTGYSIDISVI